MKTLVRFSIFFGFLLPFALHAQQRADVERHAFIVGNSNYGGNLSLANPVNDATDMVEVLKKLGYKIHTDKAQLDLTRIQFEQEFKEFVRRLPPKSVAMVYYAGHGMASNDDNYLIPIGAELEYEDQLRDRTTGLRGLVNHLSRNNSKGFNIFLLDACRDNILKTRGYAGGLQSIGAAPQGTFIGYAAAQGQIAADGTGQRNGIYTGELITALNTSAGVPIEQVHKAVAERVFVKTKSKQFPVSDQRFLGEYCFGTCNRKPDSGAITNQVTGTPALPAIASNTGSTDAEGRDTLPSLASGNNPNANAEPVSEKTFKPWMGVLGAIVVGALLASGGDPPPMEEFTITVTPPPSQ